LKKIIISFPKVVDVVDLETAKKLIETDEYLVLLIPAEDLEIDE